MRKILTPTILFILALAACSEVRAQGHNYALDSQATASSSASASPGFAAKWAIDGDRSGVGWGTWGGWNDATREVFPDTLTVNFGSAREFAVGRVLVTTLQDSYLTPNQPTPAPGQTCTSYGVRDFTVEVLSQSGAVVATQSVVGNTLCEREVVFPGAPRGAGFRVTVHSSWDGLYSRIVEAGAYR